MPSCSSMNFERLARQNVDFFLVEGVAGGIAQLDVMVSGTKRELLQLSGCTCVAAIDVNHGVFRYVNKFHFSSSRIGGVTVAITITVRITPISIRPVPTGAIPAPPTPTRTVKSPAELRRGGWDNKEKRQQGNRGHL